MLCRIFNRMRLAVKGADRQSSSLVWLKNVEGAGGANGPNRWWFLTAYRQNKDENASPAISPVTAIEISKEILCFVKY